MRAWLVVALGGLIGTALGAATAAASPGEVYGVGPRGVGTAGAMTALAEDGAAAFYNPAGLGLGAAAGKVSVSVGYLAGLPLVGIRRELGDEARLASVPTQLPSTQGFGYLSALFPLGGKLQNRAALGLMLHHPQDKLVRVQLLDPKLPQWTRFNASPDRFEMAVGLGACLHEKVSIGVGATVLAGLDGDVDFRIDLFGRRVETRTLDFRLRTVIAPVAGFTVSPTPALRLSFNYRGSIALGITQPNSIDLGDLGNLLLDVSGVVHYSPHQLAVGAAFQPTESLRIALDAKLDLWSLAPYPGARVGVSLQGEVPQALGLDKVLSFETKDPATGFTNTLTPALGVEYTFPDGVTRLRGGYAFRPTYVPDQVKTFSNFLDNHAHVFALGTTFQFHDPSEVFSAPIKIDLAGQGQALVTREVKKEQGRADPVGNYDFGGWALGLSANIRYEF